MGLVYFYLSISYGIAYNIIVEILVLTTIVYNWGIEMKLHMHTPGEITSILKSFVVNVFED
jgi:hypothetical protein